MEYIRTRELLLTPRLAVIIAILSPYLIVVAAQGNSVCAKWCAAGFSNPGGDCTSLAAKGRGPCYQCGPFRPHPTDGMALCAQKCVDTQTDIKNCGSCKQRDQPKPLAPERSYLGTHIAALEPSLTNNVHRRQCLWFGQDLCEGVVYPLSSMRYAIDQLQCSL